MHITRKKTNYLLRASLALLVFLLSYSYSSFATSYEEPNVLMGINSTRKDDIIIDEQNHTLEKLIKSMSREDGALALLYVSDFRKGIKEAEIDLFNLILKYDKDYAFQIVNYILHEKDTAYLTTYWHDKASNQLIYKPISTIESINGLSMSNVANDIWQKISSFLPEDFSKNILSVHFERDKDKDNLITIHESTIVPGCWDINLDVNLFFQNNQDLINDYLMYITVFYYCLRDDQTESLVVKKDNYQFGEKTYKDDSFINKFYKKFWKGRRQEVNIDQYSLYKKEFLNGKASRTVYDDMAVSFVNYVRNGYARRYLGFRADKTNFFDDIEFFKKLARHFRLQLGIKVM